jgi:hypothetical protein
MKFDGDGRKTLDLVQAQAARKLAEIHQLIAPGTTSRLAYDDLQRTAAARMAQLPAAEREALRRKAMVAYSELERLMAEMSRHLNDIGEELRKVNHHSRAATAYGQTVRNRRRIAL